MANPLAYPFNPLGIITVTTAGTPVQISSATPPVPVKGIWVSPLKAKGTANSGANIYIQDGGANILFVIPKTMTEPKFISASIPGFQGNFDLTKLYVDADTSGDGLVVTAQI